MSDLPVVVPLHGALGSSDQLDPLADALRGRFCVLRLDFEGHANAPAHERPFSIEGFAENVIALLDDAGVESADLFGYSMGGYVAVHLAAARPDRIGRIATLGTLLRDLGDRPSLTDASATLRPQAGSETIIESCQSPT